MVEGDEGQLLRRNGKEEWINEDATMTEGERRGVRAEVGR